jgi:hypothetical protein
MLTIEDRWAIAETLSRHGHLFDEGLLDRLDELFTPDVVYDVSELGSEVFVGIDAIRAGALALGARNPLAHIVTNIVIDEPESAGAVTVRSKGIAIMSGGACGSATYVDTVRRTPRGWRIAHRKILPRREPLGGLTAPVQ